MELCTGVEIVGTFQSWRYQRTKPSPNRKGRSGEPPSAYRDYSRGYVRRRDHGSRPCPLKTQNLLKSQPVPPHTFSRIPSPPSSPIDSTTYQKRAIPAVKYVVTAGNVYTISVLKTCFTVDAPPPDSLQRVVERPVERQDRDGPVSQPTVDQRPCLGRRPAVNTRTLRGTNSRRSWR